MVRWPLPDTYPALYVAYLYYFNEKRDYYECHEVLETLWLETARHPLYQGLLQVAVGLYHFRNGNVSGARKLLHSALPKLAPFPDNCLGIHLGNLKRAAMDYLAKLEAYDQHPFPFYDLDIEIHDPALQKQVANWTTSQDQS